MLDANWTYVGLFGGTRLAETVLIQSDSQSQEAAADMPPSELKRGSRFASPVAAIEHRLDPGLRGPRPHLAAARPRGRRPRQTLVTTW